MYLPGRQMQLGTGVRDMWRWGATAPRPPSSSASIFRQILASPLQVAILTYRFSLSNARNWMVFWLRAAMFIGLSLCLGTIFLWVTGRGLGADPGATGHGSLALGCAGVLPRSWGVVTLPLEW